MFPPQHPELIRGAGRFTAREVSADGPAFGFFAGTVYRARPDTKLRITHSITFACNAALTRRER